MITCPAVFDQVEKDKLRQAAKLAGFKEIELLEEPVAAAIAYSEAGLKVGRYVAVYDLGGGTFDLAVLVREEGEGTFRLAIEPRGERIGGEDFDKAIYECFDNKLHKQTGKPICSDGVDLHLLRQCRKFKEKLTSHEKPPPFSWFCPRKGNIGGLGLKRARFEELIEKHVERTIQLTGLILKDAVAAGYKIELVILIGGSAKFL